MAEGGSITHRTINNLINDLLTFLSPLGLPLPFPLPLPRFSLPLNPFLKQPLDISHLLSPPTPTAPPLCFCNVI